MWLSAEVRRTTEGIASIDVYLLSDALTYQSLPQDFSEIFSALWGSWQRDADLRG